MIWITAVAVAIYTRFARMRYNLRLRYNLATLDCDIFWLALKCDIISLRSVGITLIRSVENALLVVYRLSWQNTSVQTIAV